MASLALLGVVLASPADAQRRGAGGRDGPARVDTTFSFEQGGILEIRMPGLGNGSADVVVTGWTRNAVRVVGEVEDGELTFEVSPRRAEVSTRSRRGHVEVDRLELQVPVGTRIRIDNGGGDITVRGVRGALEARSFNGDITVADAADRVELKTFNGDITVDGATGRLELRASNGDVDVTNANGEVDVETLNGDIDLMRTTSRNVRAKTMSGRIAYDGSVEPTGKYELNAFSGEIDMAIPAGTDATLTVSTFSGTIDSPDFPLTLKPGARSRESRGQSMTFDLGNGGARISLESFSGEIRIRQRRASSNDN